MENNAKEIIAEIRADIKSDEASLPFDRDNYMIPGYVLRELLRGYDAASDLQDRLDACVEQDNESGGDGRPWWEDC